MTLLRKRTLRHRLIAQHCLLLSRWAGGLCWSLFICRFVSFYLWLCLCLCLQCRCPSLRSPEMEPNMKPFRPQNANHNWPNSLSRPGPTGSHPVGAGLCRAQLGCVSVFVSVSVFLFVSVFGFACRIVWLTLCLAVSCFSVFLVVVFCFSLCLCLCFCIYL